MGEAIYYAKVRFESQEKAEESLPKVEAFLKRMSEAEDKWQETRDGGKDADDARRLEFPEVYLALKLPKPENEFSNYCAGKLSSPYGQEYWEIRTDGDCILFSGTVWHFADWEPLMDAMKQCFGAIVAGYLSDEYAETDIYSQISV